ncbi:MAG: fimbrial protein [Pseudomonas proteolytica]|uniref:fimbrial protein n=1 Tax=Pseudomonas proteolytica TaxID=219574 RepID=UPI003F35228B
MLHTFIKSVLVPVLLWAVANTATALTCDYKDDIKPADGDMPIQISAITVGRDVPLGTEVYRQTFSVASGRSATIECKYAPFQMWTEYVVEPSLGLANWSSGKYANKVYKTNIQGLGVAFNGPGALPMPRTSNKAQTTCNSQTPCPVPLYQITNYELILIKIANVTPGVLRASSFPKVSAYANFNTIRMLGFSMGTYGDIQIVSRTCSTPDVVVTMGTHQTKQFTGLNSATAWKDFSINLNNCPAFHGTYNTGAPSWTSESGVYPGGEGTSGLPTDNKLLFRIDPAQVAINAANGVLSLDPSSTGRPLAASGVGIQIATPNNAPIPLGTNRSSGLNLNTSVGSYSIPLRARYLQTGSKVTPGPANASATFTITYQ